MRPSAWTIAAAPGARVSHPGGGLWGGKQRKEVEQFLKWGTAPNPVEVARVAGFDGWFWFGHGWFGYGLVMVGFGYGWFWFGGSFLWSSVLLVGFWLAGV